MRKLHVLSRPRISVALAAISGIGIIFALSGCTNEALQATRYGPQREINTEISGLVKIRPNGYLFVRDWKSDRQSGPRLAFLDVGDTGLSVKDIEIDGLGGRDQPNDLESICSIPDGQDEYLLVESGYAQGKFGRIIRTKVTEEQGIWRASLLGVLHPTPPNTEWKDLSTPSVDQIEGIGCVLDQSNRLWILLGKRGGKRIPGYLIWGEVKDFKSPRPSFILTGEQSLSGNPLADRAIGEIYLEPLRSGEWRVWTVATVDEGNQGPFRSMIYSPGRLSVDQSEGALFSLDQHSDSWMVEGLKVEGLAAPPDLLPSSVMAIGTDDEDYTGVWRPLPKRHLADKYRLNAR